MERKRFSVLFFIKRSKLLKNGEAPVRVRFSAAPVQPAVPAGNWPGPSLPERPHRQVHGGVQRQDKP